MKVEQKGTYLLSVTRLCSGRQRTHYDRLRHSPGVERGPRRSPAASSRSSVLPSSSSRSAVDYCRSFCGVVVGLIQGQVRYPFKHIHKRRKKNSGPWKTNMLIFGQHRQTSHTQKFIQKFAYRFYFQFYRCFTAFLSWFF